jgi:hypothetical protein
VVVHRRHAGDRDEGIVTAKRVPRPTCDAISRRPPSVSTVPRTTSIPTPRPETSVVSSTVENPASVIK